MNKFILILITLSLSLSAHATSYLTKRTPQISNDKVTAWQTIIYPNTTQTLKLHRHDHDRVVVTLTSGKLKVVNNKGESHILELVKDQAYYLPKDPANETHTDENLGKKSVKVLVIELNS